jgi:hypothetical protein
MARSGAVRPVERGTEDSLHCGTEDEIVLPVLFITGAPQCGSELRPMPRPIQERVRKAFTAAGLHVSRGRRKGHHLVPFFVVRLFENFSPFQERRVRGGENGIGRGIVNAVDKSGWINFGSACDRFAEQPFGKEQIDEDDMRKQVADCRRAGDVDFDVECLRVLVEPVVPAVRLLRACSRSSEKPTEFLGMVAVIVGTPRRRVQSYLHSGCRDALGRHASLRLFRRLLKYQI